MIVFISSIRCFNKYLFETLSPKNTRVFHLLLYIKAIMSIHLANVASSLAILRWVVPFGWPGLEAFTGVEVIDMNL